MLGSRANRQDQLGGGGSGRVFVIDDGKRQRTELARNLRRFDEIGTAAGLRHHDEKGVAKIRRPLVGRHDGRCGGGCEQAKPRFEKVAQIDSDMTGAAAPAENDDARPGPLEPVAIAANTSVRARRRSAAAGISAVSRAIALPVCGSAIVVRGRVPGRVDGRAQIAAVALQ